jgi:two-component system, cell cycle sensor histidine kinase and response regulator CckA
VAAAESPGDEGGEPLELRIRQQRAVADLGLRALAGESVDSVAEGVVDAAARGLGTQYASVLMLEEEQGRLVMTAGFGWPPELVAEGVYAPLDGPSPAAETVRTGEPVMIEDVPGHASASQSRLLTMHGVVSSVTVPIRGRPRMHGVLSVHSTRRRAFTTDDLFFLRSLANVLAATTERLKAEEAARAIFEGASEAMLLLDGDDLYVDSNEAAVQLLGRPRDEIVGCKASDLVAPDRDAELPNVLERLRAGETLTGETRIVRPDGEVRQAEWSARGNLTAGRHLLIVKDVTERRSLQEQLARAQKLQAVGELAGGVAHDFNNLLTAILGYTDFALSSLGEDAAGRSELDGIRTAAERGAALTRRLLAIGRSRLVQPEAVDLGDLVRSTETLLRRTIGEEIELRTSLVEGLVVLADPGEIEQVILNLAVNARDAMPAGGPLRLTTEEAEVDEEYARTHLELEPGRYAVLTVDDSGIGMDEEVQRRAFEPFFTTKDETRGSGLGLSTSYGIVRQAGGTIWLYSEPGLGTSVKVYLPRVEAPTAEQPRPRRPAPERRGHERILLVEDDEVLRSLIELILRERGYAVVSATRADEAMELFEARAGEFDLVLSDHVLPGMRGHELALRFRERTPGLPVVLMSGYAGNTLELGDLASAALFIEKPFAPDALAETVRAALGGTAAP